MLATGVFSFLKEISKTLFGMADDVTIPLSVWPWCWRPAEACQKPEKSKVISVDAKHQAYRLDRCVPHAMVKNKQHARPSLNEATHGSALRWTRFS